MNSQNNNFSFFQSEIFKVIIPSRFKFSSPYFHNYFNVFHNNMYLNISQHNKIFIADRLTQTSKFLLTISLTQIPVPANFRSLRFHLGKLSISIPSILLSASRSYPIYDVKIWMNCFSISNITTILTESISRPALLSAISNVVLAIQMGYYLFAR